MQRLYGVSESYTNVTTHLFRMTSMRSQLQLRQVCALAIRRSVYLDSALRQF